MVVSTVSTRVGSKRAALRSIVSESRSWHPLPGNWPAFEVGAAALQMMMAATASGSSTAGAGDSAMHRAAYHGCLPTDALHRTHRVAPKVGLQLDALRGHA